MYLIADSKDVSLLISNAMSAAEDIDKISRNTKRLNKSPVNSIPIIPTSISKKRV